MVPGPSPASGAAPRTRATNSVSRVIRARAAAAVGLTRTLPDFLVLGAAKAGTTSLLRFLTARPGVHPPSEDEVHFFDVHWDRGVAWYRSHFPARALRAMARARRRPFATGEASPYYLF